MTMEENVEETWMRELQEFISHWENEVNSIQEQQLDSRECSNIVEHFQRERDLLLCKKPVGISDEHSVIRLEPLANKLDASLAMALCSIKKRESEF